LPINFPKNDLPRIPDHWCSFGARVSPLTGSPRLAANPPNAILNYLYSVLESEARLAAAALGLDPGLGVLHVDTSARDSLACDLMEPVRSEIDAYLLDWITRQPLRREWFSEQRDGNCRLAGSFAVRLSETSPIFGGYFASQYALAHLLHEPDSNYAGARELLEPVWQSDQYPDVLKYRAVMSMGDAWFAEKHFEKSAECYAQALAGHFVRGLRRHIQERLIDSLSRGGHTNEAFVTVVSILRRRRRALSLDEKGHLYARLAFTSVERKNFTQTAIACCGLRRLAENAGSDQYHWLCLYLASWTVKQIGVHDDLLTPPQDVGFRDICALSEAVPDESLKEWRENDKANVKTVIQISAIFELEKQYKRAFAQLKKAKRILVNTLPNAFH
jgi:hypothetical protein